MKYTILYVDDEEYNLRGFKRVFRKKYKVYTATSGREGLEILAKEKCHLVITDQRMPHMTGVEFLKLIAEEKSTMQPIRMVLSGFSEPEDIQIAKDKYHLYMFIRKPYDPKELILIMDKALEETYGE